MGAGRPCRVKRVSPRRRQEDGTAGGVRQEAGGLAPGVTGCAGPPLVLEPDAGKS